MRPLVIFLFTLLVGLSAAHAGYVSPKIGGGQTGIGAEDPQLMIHIHVGFNGSDSRVEVGMAPGVASLRPLVDPDEFDPAQPWGVLGTKAYNFQYGWLASSFEFPPIGSWFWIEQLSATPGLESYQRPPASPSYAPIFGTDGSSTRWRWSGAMTHNVYAVQDPSLEHYEAEYRVYVGDDVTGEPLAGYAPAEITLQFAADPILTADFNDDERVDGNDLSIWRQHYGMTNGDLNDFGDTNSDGDVDGHDVLDWQRQFSRDADAITTTIPEPAVISLAIVAIGNLALRRNR